MSRPIEDYALIGDCETAALVSRDGSIDWLCWPRFDSAACLAALLGDRHNGRWLIAPRDRDFSVARRYRGHTLILETTFTTSTGRVTLIDFMPPRGTNSDVVRMVRGDAGHVEMDLELILRFDYGRTVPWMTRRADGSYCAIAGPDLVVLHTPVTLHGQDLTTVGQFDVEAGTSLSFVLTHGPSHLPPPDAAEPEAALAGTEAFWNDWMRQGVEGDWADVLGRSLVTLKALTYAPTGGLVAAPTTSLPECIGGTRNWDYRFCWVRDATLTLLALMNAGYYGEARAWRDWLLRAAAGAPAQLQIMYGVGGERRLPETTLPWLPGYAKSAPVRIGNDAADQLQLDVYGELMDALYHARRGGLTPRESDWAFQSALLEHLETVWEEPDAGIWEMRGPPQHFTFSKVMAWVAFDRGVRTAEQFGLPAPLDRWRRVRTMIHETVCRSGFDPEKGSFTQAFHSKELDASLLLLPTVGFLPASDARIRGTIAAIERELLIDGVVLRYHTGSGADGLPPGEGAFLACTLWLADAFVLIGRLDEARALFDHVRSLANDLGLLAEEYDPRAKRLTGNFPQAFSHVAIINTAHNLARSTKPAQQRAS